MVWVEVYVKFSGKSFSGGELLGFFVLEEMLGSLRVGIIILLLLVILLLLLEVLMVVN